MRHPLRKHIERPAHRSQRQAQRQGLRQRQWLRQRREPLLRVPGDLAARLQELIARRLPVAQERGPGLRVPMVILLALRRVLGLDQMRLDGVAIVGLALIAREGLLDRDPVLLLLDVLFREAFFENMLMALERPVALDAQVVQFRARRCDDGAKQVAVALVALALFRDICFFHEPQTHRTQETREVSAVAKRQPKRDDAVVRPAALAVDIPVAERQDDCGGGEPIIPERREQPRRRREEEPACDENQPRQSAVDETRALHGL